MPCVGRQPVRDTSREAHFGHGRGRAARTTNEDRTESWLRPSSQDGLGNSLDGTSLTTGDALNPCSLARSRPFLGDGFGKGLLPVRQGQLLRWSRRRPREREPRSQLFPRR